MPPKESPQEAANLIDSIMKVLVTPNKVKCPVCGADAKLLEGQRSDYECAKGHIFAA